MTINFKTNPGTPRDLNNIDKLSNDTKTMSHKDTGIQTDKLRLSPDLSAELSSMRLSWAWLGACVDIPCNVVNRFNRKCD